MIDTTSKKFFAWKREEIKRAYNYMMKSCYDQSFPNYFRCGKKGKYVCKRWRSGFTSFFVDMQGSWFPNAVLILEDRNMFSKNNSKWVSNEEVSMRRRSLLCEVSPGWFMTLGDAVDKLGLDVRQIKARYRTIRKEKLFHETKKYFDNVFR